MRPGENIQPWEEERVLSLKGSHPGPVAIISNGPSVLKWDLSKIPEDVLVIGVNQAWRLPVDLDLLLWAECTHETWLKKDNPELWNQMLDAKKILGIGGHYFSSKVWDERVCRTRVGTYRSTGKFSDDIQKDGLVVDFGLCGTVSYAALQLAAWLGSKDIYYIGLDLEGLKFNGMPTGNLKGQQELFRIAKPEVESRGLNVKVIGLESKCDAFERIAWPWI